MTRALIIEPSATLRHVAANALDGEGYAIEQTASFEAGLRALRGEAQPEAVILGWPVRTDPVADELLAALGSPELNTVAVVILGEIPDSAVRTWTTHRPHTSMLQWDQHKEIAESLDALLAGAREAGQPPRVAPLQVLEDNATTRILLVDDSPTVRVNFRKLLMGHGYQVDTASSVEEGLRCARNGHYDIAIVDYFMPQETGDGLCRRLREDSTTAHITTAIITGTYLDRVIRDSLEAGAVECMFKNEADVLFLARVDAMKRSIDRQRSIERERRRLEGILASVGDGVYGVNNDGDITFMNPTARGILRIESDAPVEGESPHALFHAAFPDGTPNPEDRCFLSRAYRTGECLTNWQTAFWTTDERPVPVECTVYPLHIDGHREGSVVAFRDISERKLMEEELRWQANHDSLTRLLNRHYFEGQLEQEVHRLRRTEERAALLYVDLDQFKYINDTAGHAAGDRLLIHVGQQLQTRLRASDTLARLGGDEFAILLRAIDADAVEATADSFRQAIADRAFVYGGKSYKITASLGVALMDHNTRSPGEALSNADIACHLAKENGRNQTHVHSPEADRRRTMDLELGWSARLHEALEKNTFELVYHPIVEIGQPLFQALQHGDGRTPCWEGVRQRLRGGQPHFEVLLRLKGMGGEVVFPDAFLPTAERFNLMPKIDRWVLEHAMEVLAECNRDNAPATFSVNLSAHSLMDDTLPGEIRRLIHHYGVAPESLIFEITESCAITNMDAARRFIGALHEVGCRFALDDFGSGFCSFGHLKHLDVEFIKIDGLFTQGVVSDPIDRAVVVSIVEIAHALGMKTVAEFVESRDLVALLQECGVDYIQGNLLTTPLSEIVGEPDRLPK